MEASWNPALRPDSHSTTLPPTHREKELDDSAAAPIHQEKATEVDIYASEKDPDAVEASGDSLHLDAWSRDIPGSAETGQSSLRSEGGPVIYGHAPSTSLDKSPREDEVGYSNITAPDPPTRAGNGNEIPAVDKTNLGTADLLSTTTNMPNEHWPDNLDEDDAFPEVVPLSPISVADDSFLVKSQAKAILDEARSDPTSQQWNVSDGKYSSANVLTGDDYDPAFDTFPDASLHSRMPGDDLQNATVQEDFARFEEGIPLVSQNKTEVAAPSVYDAFSLDEGGDQILDDGGFFDDHPGSADLHGAIPNTLHRKPTSQVLQSLHYKPNGKTLPSLPAHQDALPATSLGEATAAPHVDGSSAPVDMLSTKALNETTDEGDLDDLWKAALADDDFVEEEDAMDDSPGLFEDDNDDAVWPDIAENAAEHPAFPPQTSDSPGARRAENHKNRPSGGSNAYVPSIGVPHRQPVSLSTSLSSPGAPDQSVAPSAFSNAYSLNQHPPPGIPVPSRPQLQQSAQSFVDKSKSGYVSPYDLPMDVTRPKRRAPPPSTTSTNTTTLADGRPAPPRRSSILSPHRALPPNPPLDQGAMPVIPNHESSAPTSKPGTSNFFEDLPSSKPRPSSAAGKYPAHTAPSLPPFGRSQTIPLSLPGGDSSHSTPSVKQPDYQLAPQPKLDMFQDLPSQALQRPGVPPPNARYSPAPVQNSFVHPTTQRYAASPVTAPRPPSSHPPSYQPRTSSPLTHRSYNHHQPTDPSSSDYQTQRAPVNTTAPRPMGHASQLGNLSNYNQAPVYHDGMPHGQNLPRVAESPPMVQQFGTIGGSSSPSASSHVIYTPGAEQSSPESPIPPMASERGPPRRSQTQSPDQLRAAHYTNDAFVPHPRPASVQHYKSQPASHDMQRTTLARQTTREASLPDEHVQPVDGREMDELERWKGCPIFSFGFGGKIVKMFPQRVPRYVAGQRHPLIKSSPGEVKLGHDKDTQLPDTVTSFPGPLKSKGKKKEVLDWLRQRLQSMEGASEMPRTKAHNLPDPAKCQQERVLLWRIMEIFVEHDGALEGKPAIEKAVRDVLSPEVDSPLGLETPMSPGRSLNGITRKGVHPNLSEPLRSESLEQLRKLLLRGEREQAAWHCVDSRLWAHAMLIASTLNENVRKQVAQEFVRQDVKTSAENTEALSALFQIFAGNRIESIDELVPPSARAGLQMVSKSTGTGPIKNALDGLDRWRETLTLILSNRSPDDSEAIIALGRLLADYGRIEAAHVCFMFAKNPSLFGGPDDPQVNVSLLGVDHTRRPFDYGRDFDSILLTEVYEYASTVLSTASMLTNSPHLQAYRLYHATVLAEHGFKAEAQQYCDAITTTMKSTTKISPYYHSLLVGSLQTLQERLKQIPQEHSGSWISKPSIDKVSGSIWAKFNSYVAGDENDAASATSGTLGDPSAGPFAGVAGDTSMLSRTASSSELNTYASNAAYQPTPYNSSASTVSGGLYAPQISTEQRRQPQSELLRPALAPHTYSSRPSSSASMNTNPYTPNPSPYAPRSDSYVPTPSSQEFRAAPALPHQSSEQSNPHPQTTPLSDYSQDDILAPSHQTPDKPQVLHSMASEATGPYAYAYDPTTQHSSNHESSDYTSRMNEGQMDNKHLPHDEQSQYDQSQDTYQPPTFSYEPPSYDPGAVAVDDQVGDRPEKSVMDIDDEDEFEARASALRKEEKARKDRETDEAFKKAAEADAQKDRVPKLNSKKSWFGGGWFGGNKEKSSDPGTLNAPVQVKLGEESSFYFDKDLGKWVNKKGGNEEKAPSKAQAPPKGPPSRAVSAAAGPPRGQTLTPPVPPIPTGIGMGTNSPSSRAVSGPSFPRAPPSHEPSRTATPVLDASQSPVDPTRPPGPPSAPPSRPATAQSAGNDLDDLYGVGQARKSGTVKRAKKGRGYVDVMAK